MKKKLPFQFGDWVSFEETIKFTAEHEPGQWHSWNRVQEVRKLYRKTPAIGRVVGIVRRCTGKCTHYSEEGNFFKTEKSILVVQVRRSLTSKIEECLPEQLTKVYPEEGKEFPDRIFEYRWPVSDEDRKFLREEAAKMKRDSKGRFLKCIPVPKTCSAKCQDESFCDHHPEVCEISSSSEKTGEHVRDFLAESELSFSEELAKYIEEHPEEAEAATKKHADDQDEEIVMRMFGQIKHKEGEECY